jgi:hypothetical protein
MRVILQQVQSITEKMSNEGKTIIYIQINQLFGAEPYSKGHELSI